MSLVRFLGLTWPDKAHELLRISIKEVQAFRDELHKSGKAPKTINRCVCFVSSFYKYLAAFAAEMRLPVNVLNPAHAQFIARESADPNLETKALTAARAR